MWTREAVKLSLEEGDAEIAKKIKSLVDQIVKNYEERGEVIKPMVVLPQPTNAKEMSTFLYAIEQLKILGITCTAPSLEESNSPAVRKGKKAGELLKQHMLQGISEINVWRERLDGIVERAHASKVIEPIEGVVITRHASTELGVVLVCGPDERDGKAGDADYRAGMERVLGRNVHRIRIEAEEDRNAVGVRYDIVVKGRESKHLILDKYIRSEQLVVRGIEVSCLITSKIIEECKAVSRQGKAPVVHLSLRPPQTGTVLMPADIAEIRKRRIPFVITCHEYTLYRSQGPENISYLQGMLKAADKVLFFNRLDMEQAKKECGLSESQCCIVPLCTSLTIKGTEQWQETIDAEEYVSHETNPNVIVFSSLRKGRGLDKLYHVSRLLGQQCTTIKDLVVMGKVSDASELDRCMQGVLSNNHYEAAKVIIKKCCGTTKTHGGSAMALWLNALGDTPCSFSFTSVVEEAGHTITFLLNQDEQEVDRVLKSSRYMLAFDDEKGYSNNMSSAQAALAYGVVVIGEDKGLTRGMGTGTDSCVPLGVSIREKGQELVRMVELITQCESTQQTKIDILRQQVPLAQRLSCGHVRDELTAVYHDVAPTPPLTEIVQNSRAWLSHIEKYLKENIPDEKMRDQVDHEVGKKYKEKIESGEISLNEIDKAIEEELHIRQQFKIEESLSQQLSEEMPRDYYGGGGGPE